MHVSGLLSRLFVATIAVGLALAIPAANATENEHHTLPLPPVPVVTSVQSSMSAGSVAVDQTPVAAPHVAVPGKPLAGKVILIDPGHGGKDSGTQQSYTSCGLTSPNGATMINEKDITIKIAFKLKADLEAQGATVYMTRETDVFVDLWDRVAMQKDVSLTPQGQRDHAAHRAADIFISIHVNSVNYKTDFDQIQVYSYYPPGKELSEKIAPVLQQEMGKTTRVINPMDFRVVDHNPDIPTILIETGFITKSSTCRDLVTDAYQARMAQAIADGVDNYFGVTHPASLPAVEQWDPREHQDSGSHHAKSAPAKHIRHHPAHHTRKHHR